MLLLCWALLKVVIAFFPSSHRSCRNYYGITINPESLILVNGDTSSDSATPKEINDIWNSLSCIEVQAESLRTCSFDKAFERVQVFLKTEEGQSINTMIELWQGLDNSPQRIGVHLDNGSKTPFRSVIEVPGGFNSIAISNRHLKFPVTAGIEASKGSELNSPISPVKSLMSMSKSTVVQGGSDYDTSFGASVASVQIALLTDGRPLNARIELVQSHNKYKQSMEVYCEDGEERPFYIVIETPTPGSVVRIVNTATEEFPLLAFLEPYRIDSSVNLSDCM